MSKQIVIIQNQDSISEFLKKTIESNVSDVEVTIFDSSKDSDILQGVNLVITDLLLDPIAGINMIRKYNSLCDIYIYTNGCDDCNLLGQLMNLGVNGYYEHKNITDMIKRIV